MSAPIVSIDEISRQASDAASNWKLGEDKPANPYDEHMAPAHHRAWRERFEIALLRLSAQESEASA